MSTWQLQEVKARLSEVVRLCLTDGPQMMSIRGKEEVVILSKKEYETLLGGKKNLFDFMQSSPLKGSEIEVERDKFDLREINF